MLSKFAIFSCIALAYVPCEAQNMNMPSRTVVLQVKSCSFNVRDMFNGSISAPGKENNFESAGYSAEIHISGAERSFGFNFSCHSQFDDVNEVAKEYGGHFELEEKKWVPDFPGASADDVLQLKEITRTLPLQSKNGHGFYTIQDDTVGEPNRRVRHISYCLFHEKKAICGFGDVKRLADPKDDMLPYALKILRSVEFTDTDPDTLVQP